MSAGRRFTGAPTPAGGVLRDAPSSSGIRKLRHVGVSRTENPGGGCGRRWEFGLMLRVGAGLRSSEALRTTLFEPLVKSSVIINFQ